MSQAREGTASTRIGRAVVPRSRRIRARPRCVRERDAQGERIHRFELETRFLRRLGVGFLAWMPIDWMS